MPCLLNKWSITYIVIISLIFSCKKHNNPEVDKTKILDVNFNDSIVYKGKFTTGNIIYDTSLDSLNYDDISDRYILFFASTNKEESKTLENIKNTASYALMDTIENGVFNFEIKFSNEGENELRIAIVDKIFLKDKKNEVIKNITILSYPIYVIDSTSIIGSKGDSIYFEKKEKIKIKRKDSARILKEAKQKIDSMKRVLNTP